MFTLVMRLLVQITSDDSSMQTLPVMVQHFLYQLKHSQVFLDIQHWP